MTLVYERENERQNNPIADKSSITIGVFMDGTANNSYNVARGNDKIRDVIKFETPPVGNSIINIDRATLNRLPDINTLIRNRQKEFKRATLVKGTLSDTGWKGIYAQDINTFIISRKDIKGEPDNENYAWKFPVGWKAGDTALDTEILDLIRKD